MVRLKTSVIVLAMMAMAVVLSGCASTSPDPGKPLVVATVGAPTPIPTDVPEPTPGPTWVPSPTPRPPPLTLSDYTLTVKINGDQQLVSGDPNFDYQLNPQYAIRQDTVTFKVQNTGDFTLTALEIVYGLITPQTYVDSYSGQTVTSYQAKDDKTDIGTLNPGEGREISIVSPPYGAMLEANVTISAKWDNGSMDLYKATLEPNLKSGSNINPTNDLQIKMQGSAKNW
jgi:hypothetical protein